jgi:hypothetical protein
MTARLLRQLGCQVTGDPGRSAFKVVGKQEVPPVVDTGTALAATSTRTQPPTAAVRASVVTKSPSRSQPPTAAAREAAYTKLDVE